MPTAVRVLDQIAAMSDYGSALVWAGLHTFQSTIIVSSASAAASISMASLLAPAATGDTYFAVGRALSTGNAALIGHSTVGSSAKYAFLTTYARPASDLTVTEHGWTGLGTADPSASVHVKNTWAASLICQIIQGFASQAAVLLQLQGISSTSTVREQANVDTAWNAIDGAAGTDATRSADLILSTWSVTTAQEGIRIRSAAAGVRLGFYGVTPAARQLLATGAGATVDQVITALQTLGLLRQS